MEQQGEASEDEAEGEGLVASGPDGETMPAGLWRFLSVFKGTGGAPPRIVGVPLVG